jgi:hypothetical protein
MVVSSLLPFEVQPGVVLADDREIGFFGEGDMSHPIGFGPPAQIIVKPIRLMAIPLLAGGRASLR